MHNKEFLLDIRIRLNVLPIFFSVLISNF